MIKISFKTRNKKIRNKRMLFNNQKIELKNKNRMNYNKLKNKRLIRIK